MLETLHFLGNNSTIYFFIDIGNLKPNRMRGLDFTSLWITLTPTNCMRYNPGHCIYLSLDVKIGSCNPSSLLPPLQLSSAPTVARFKNPVEFP